MISDYLGRQVGKIRNAKEELKKRVVPRELRPEKRKSFQTYQESDSPSIARKVRELGLARRPGARRHSYVRFLSSVDQCHSPHLVERE